MSVLTSLFVCGMFAMIIKKSLSGARNKFGLNTIASASGVI